MVGGEEVYLYGLIMKEQRTLSYRLFLHQAIKKASCSPPTLMLFLNRAGRRIESAWLRPKGSPGPAWPGALRQLSLLPARKKNIRVWAPLSAHDTAKERKREQRMEKEPLFTHFLLAVPAPSFRSHFFLKPCQEAGYTLLFITFSLKKACLLAFFKADRDEREACNDRKRIRNEKRVLLASPNPFPIPPPTHDGRSTIQVPRQS